LSTICLERKNTKPHKKKTKKKKKKRKKKKKKKQQKKGPGAGKEGLWPLDAVRYD